MYLLARFSKDSDLGNQLVHVATTATLSVHTGNKVETLFSQVNDQQICCRESGLNKKARPNIYSSSVLMILSRETLSTLSTIYRSLFYHSIELKYQSHRKTAVSSAAVTMQYGLAIFLILANHLVAAQWGASQCINFIGSCDVARTSSCAQTFCNSCTGLGLPAINTCCAANTGVNACLSSVLIGTATAPSNSLITSSAVMGDDSGNLPLACTTVDRLVSSCDAATPGFDNLPFSQRASCLCYSSSIWTPQFYDNAFSSCWNSVSLEYPDAYASIVATQPIVLNRCRSAGNVMAGVLTVSTTSSSTARSASAAAPVSVTSTTSSTSATSTTSTTSVTTSQTTSPTGGHSLTQTVWPVSTSATKGDAKQLHVSLLIRVLPIPILT